MSIQDYDWPQGLQQRLALADTEGPEAPAAAAEAEAAFYDELLERICTSGRPFLLMEVSCCCSAQSRLDLPSCSYRTAALWVCCMPVSMQEPSSMTWPSLLAGRYRQCPCKLS